MHARAGQFTKLRISTGGMKLPRSCSLSCRRASHSASRRSVLRRHRFHNNGDILASCRTLPPQRERTLGKNSTILSVFIAGGGDYNPYFLNASLARLTNGLEASKPVQLAAIAANSPLAPALRAKPFLRRTPSPTASSQTAASSVPAKSPSTNTSPTPCAWNSPRSASSNTTSLTRHVASAPLRRCRSGLRPNQCHSCRLHSGPMKDETLANSSLPSTVPAPRAHGLLRKFTADLPSLQSDRVYRNEVFKPHGPLRRWPRRLPRHSNGAQSGNPGHLPHRGGERQGRTGRRPLPVTAPVSPHGRPQMLCPLSCQQPRIGFFRNSPSAVF